MAPPPALQACRPRWRAAFDRDGFVTVPTSSPPSSSAFARPCWKAIRCARPAARRHGHPPSADRAGAAARGPELATFSTTAAGPACSPMSQAPEASRFIISRPSPAGLAEGPPDPQLELHSDTFHPSLKAWLFLTDVAERRPAADLCRRVAPADAGAPCLGAAQEQDARPTAATGYPSAARCGLRTTSWRRSACRRRQLRRPGQHFGRCRHLRLPCPRRVRPSDDPRRNLGLCRRTPFLPWTGFDLLSPRLSPSVARNGSRPSSTASSGSAWPGSTGNRSTESGR